MIMKYSVFFKLKHTQGPVAVQFPLALIIRLLPLLVLLSSCWHPPFDPDVSASLVTTEKLGSPVWEGRFSLPYEARGGYYLPSCFEPINYNQGFWIGLDETSLRMSHAAFDIVTKQGFLDNYRVFPIPNRDGFKFLPDRNNASGLYISLVSLKGWYNLDFSNNVFTPTSVSGDPFLGAGYTLEENGVPKHYVYIATITTYPLDQIKISAYSLESPTLSEYYFTPPSVLPDTPTLAVMRQEHAYLSGLLTDGTGVTYYWSGPATEPVRLSVDRPLTGMLSDGRLLADTGDRLYIYEPDGSSGFYFPTGALHFSFERYDNLNFRWISVFTRTLELAVSHNDGWWDYLLSVYEIPTSRLKDLAR